MRDAADLNRIAQFMKALGGRVREQARVYLTGGATAVLHGWRSSTIDIDVRFAPEADELFRAVRDLKDELSVRAYFDAVAPQIYRFPALDEQAFRARVERVTKTED